MLIPVWNQVKERENMTMRMEIKAFKNSWAILFFLTMSASSFHQNPAFPWRSLTISSTELLYCEFWVQSVTLFTKQRRPFNLSLLASLRTGTGWSIHEHKYRDIGSVHGERVGGDLTFEDGWSLAKAFHIHGWIFSAHGGQGQFLQSARHSKVKGMWLVDEGSVRDRHAWGFMVFRWEAASCWWVTVWAWRLRTCPRKGVAIRYPHLRGWYTYAPYAEKAHINCRTFSVLVIMPSCLSERPACLNEECRLTGLWPLRKFSSAQNDLVANINCQIKLHGVCQQYW